MAITVDQGFRPYLLKHIAETVGNPATPQYKIEPVGFLNLLLSQKRPEFLRLNTAGGHRNTVQIKYKQRFNKSHTDTSKSCDVTLQSAYNEAAVELSSTRQFAIHIEDETIANYMDEASKTVAIGQPASQIMNELLEDIMLGASAICEGVNDDLLTTAEAAIGVNRVNGLATAKALNIPLNTTNLPLNAGLTEIISDYKINGFSGRPQIVGSGLMYNFMLQQASKSFDQSGFDTKVQAGGVDFYHDLAAASIVGSNEVIVYEKDAVQLVEYLEYTGFKAGYPGMGDSIFGTLTLPIAGSENMPVKFDWQLKYNSCQTTMTDAYSGGELVLEKGYNFILTKRSGLFVIPSDAYRAGDVLEGNRGSLRYAVTNS